MKTNVISFICVVVILLLYAFYKPAKGHNCRYKDCAYKGQEEFLGGADGCAPETMCWALDSVHFQHPDWDYDECDSALIQIVK